MEDLAAELTIDILSRLPVKTIIHCKGVCKKWRNLVSDSFFVNLHLSRSPPGLIIHQEFQHLDPGILQWAEIEDKVDLYHLHHDHPLMSLNLNLAPIFQNSIIRLEGSVNGLILLSGYAVPYSHDTYICNPVTREFLILPRPEYKQGFTPKVYGFGVSSLTGEYKVVRTFETANGNKSCKLSVLEAEVYTIGTGQWRSLGRVPYRLEGYSNGRFLNDHCHWIVCDEKDAPEKICTFDLNKESFQLFPSSPSEAIEECYDHYQSLGVLKGCLCKSDGGGSQFTIWVMKEYGIKKSWHKEVVILITEATIGGLEWPFAEPISLIESLKDGSILLHSGFSLWEFYPASDTVDTVEYMEGINSSDTANNGLAYRSSFLKLQKFESERVHMF